LNLNNSHPEANMRTVKEWLPVAARTLLGLLFAVFGANGFLHFLPNPPTTASGGAFLGALAATGYMFPLIKGTELVAGLLLLGGRFVPLALTLLAPVIVNIVAFHAVLAPAGVGMALFTVVLEAYVAWTYRAAFAPMLRAGATAKPAAHRQAAVA
jgi:hypothetical protein